MKFCMARECETLRIGAVLTLMPGMKKVVVSLNYVHTHTHTHTYIYIYIKAHKLIRNTEICKSLKTGGFDRRPSEYRCETSVASPSSNTHLCCSLILFFLCMVLIEL